MRLSTKALIESSLIWFITALLGTFVILTQGPYLSLLGLLLGSSGGFVAGSGLVTYLDLRRIERIADNEETRP